ncbi:phage portal protein [Paramagnetospirillum kuznetsovii]|uniref:Phage portal protein n=1 Tax=Paramagnetospirillum kuznetsovii TaxID=2053833 RepID=A0A364NSK9_9PROT|nr:phage portal protein [Paramagnetospirillum kuznetsovii]RAU20068.1 phage portal protein [Paramagnetospirillum kuznetsovii]
MLVDSFIGPKTQLVGAEHFAHFRAGSLHPLNPVSLLRAGAQCVGAAIAADAQASNLFSKAASPGGILKANGKLSNEAISRLRTSWDSAHMGAGNAYRTAILEEGMSFESLVPDLTKLQLLESRRFTVEEVARLFRIPPHMLAVVNGAPRANVEQAAVEFYTCCIQPWLERIEAVLEKCCLSPGELDAGYVVEFDEDDLIRVDFATKTAALTAGRMGGWLSPNDARRAMGLPAVEGGDDIAAPMNSNHPGDGSTANATTPPPAKAYDPTPVAESEIAANTALVDLLRGMSNA